MARISALASGVMRTWNTSLLSKSPSATLRCSMAASDIISGKHQTGPGLGSLETLCLLELLDLMRPHREVSHQPRNPTFRMAVGGDPLRAHHTFVIAPAPTHASSGTEQLLVAYVGGVGARAMRRTRSNGCVWLLPGDGEGDGKPRLFVELPG